MTNYVVLCKIGESGERSDWRQFTAISARSAKAAIAKALEGDENPYKEGTFIAIPSRSWLPRSVKVETKTALRFS